MRTFTAAEAQNKFGELVDLARAAARDPLFNPQVRCRAVRLQIGRIDHDCLRIGALDSQSFHHAEGHAALACGDVDGIDAIRLGEIQIRHGGGFLIFRSNDVFGTDSAFIRNLLQNGPIERASFKIKFTTSKNPLTVNILPANVARYNKKGGSAAVEEWLKKRGFDISEADIEVSDDDGALDRG